MAAAQGDLRRDRRHTEIRQGQAGLGQRRFGVGLRQQDRQLHRLPQPVHVAGAVARIPAKFEIGFPLPDKRGAGDVAGYHCWAKFRPEGKGWIPVDISEANKHPEMRDYYFGNLTEDRVAFSTGRDLTLVPKQDGGPVNFLIYPYVEVDGKVWPQDRIEKQFSFQGRISTPRHIPLRNGRRRSIVTPTPMRLRRPPAEGRRVGRRESSNGGTR